MFEDDGVRTVYKDPHLILKRSLKYKPILTYLEKECAFPNTVFGIHTTNKELLKAMGAYFSSSLIQYFLFLTSTTWGVEREEVLQKEYKALPWIFSKKDITQLSKLFDEVLSIAGNKYSPETLLKNENWDNQIKIKIEEINSFLEKKFELSEIEKSLIQFTSEVSIPLFFGESKVFSEANHTNFKEYAQIFINHFGKKWNGENDKYFKIDIYSDNFIVGMNFQVTKEKNDIDINFKNDLNTLQALSQALNIGLEKITDKFSAQREIRGFEKDSFYIIKPNEYKNWHPAVAQVDLHEFLQDMMKAEIKDNKK
jgi:hypothetical protein